MLSPNHHISIRHSRSTNSLGCSLLAFGLLLGFGSLSIAQSRNSDHWAGTWAAAPHPDVNLRGAYTLDTTFREFVHVSAGGSAIRVVLSNEYGTSDLKIGGVTVAFPVARPVPNVHANAAGLPDTPDQPTSAIQISSAVSVRFSNNPSVTIAPGALAISDPVPMHLTHLSDLAVTFFIPGQRIDRITYHYLASQTNFEVTGNELNAAVFDNPRPVSSWRFLKGIDVQGKTKGTIVCLGDSITDGSLSTPNTNHRYPDFLAARLQAHGSTAGFGVVNEGIGANAVLHDLNFVGANALERFDRDVLAQPDVRYLILLEGINDIRRITNTSLPPMVITADDLINGYLQLITRAHLHGIKVIGATLTPDGGSRGESEIGEAIREKVNDFILHGGMFDGVVDFAKATADPADARRFSTTAGGRDHLHPNDTGYRLMGDSIDLKLFGK